MLGVLVIWCHLVCVWEFFIFAFLYVSTLGHGSIKTYFRGFREIDEVGFPCSKSNLLTELVSYMYPIYVHYMYILDVLSFPFGSRHRPYWDCEVRSKSEWRVSCIAPIVLWLFYNTDHNRQIYRGHIPWQNQKGNKSTHISVKIHDTCEIPKWPCWRLCKNPLLLGMLQSSRDLALPCLFCMWPITMVDSRCAGCKRQKKTRAMHPQWGSSAQMKTLERKWQFLHGKIAGWLAAWGVFSGFTFGLCRRCKNPRAVVHFECQCNAFCSVYGGSCVLGLPASRSLQSCRQWMIVGTCHAMFDFFVRHPHPRARAASFLIAEALTPMFISAHAFMLGVYAKDRACTTPRHTPLHTLERDLYRVFSLWVLLWIDSICPSG